MTTTEEMLAEIRGRVEKATPGPWETRIDDGWPIGSFATGNSGEDGKDYTVQCVGNRASDLCDSGSTLDAKDDAKFIAHSREDLPYLLALVEELQNKLKIAHDIGEVNTKALLSALNELEKLKDGKG